MNFKYYLKELLWIGGLYSQFRNHYRSKNPEIIKSISEEKNFYHSLISSGDIVFDVGSHLGDKAAIFVDLNALVVSIEPDPRLINYQKKRFSGKSQVHFVNKGISSKL
ncbi:methyltransferase FkbM family protein [Chondrocystis sp. NIES-4102]|nr:methyltransferase FkbM family protein [Chondrocystis sp. NIES-4102]